jgi:hypothetical protein
MKSERELELAQILMDLEELVERMDREEGKPENWKSVREFLDQFKDES